jgi:hypothetical protein
MADRKSLADAMTMSPEKLAFIEQGNTGKERSEASTQLKTPQKTIDIQMPTHSEESMQPKVRYSRQQRRSRGARDEQPDASEILDHVLVPVTIRLQHRTTQALRRAYLEQRLMHAKPDTQQEIVEVALGEWLLKRGFLTDQEKM